MVVVDGKVIHFGDAYSQSYRDLTSLLDKKYIHGDMVRRENYLKRAKGIKDREGKEMLSQEFHQVRLHQAVVWAVFLKTLVTVSSPLIQNAEIVQR